MFSLRTFLKSASLHGKKTHGMLFVIMSTPKNIIFDLCGVIFDHPTPDQQTLYSPLKDGLLVLEHCHALAQTKGHKLFACTNWTMRYIDLLEQDYPHIFKRFEGIVTPTVAQAKKPDTKIFHYLLDTYNLVAQHSIFIDDQLTNVEAAQSVGMEAIHFSDFASVQKELMRLGI